MAVDNPQGLVWNPKTLSFEWPGMPASPGLNIPPPPPATQSFPGPGLYSINGKMWPIQDAEQWAAYAQYNPTFVAGPGAYGMNAQGGYAPLTAPAGIPGAAPSGIPAPTDISPPVAPPPPLGIPGGQPSGVPPSNDSPVPSGIPIAPGSGPMPNIPGPGGGIPTAPTAAPPPFPGIGQYVMPNGKVSSINDAEQWAYYANQGTRPIRFSPNMPTTYNPSLGTVVVGGYEAAQALSLQASPSQQGFGGVGPSFAAPPPAAPGVPPGTPPPSASSGILGQPTPPLGGLPAGLPAAPAPGSGPITGPVTGPGPTPPSVTAPPGIPGSTNVNVQTTIPWPGLTEIEAQGRISREITDANNAAAEARLRMQIAQQEGDLAARDRWAIEAQRIDALRYALEDRQFTLGQEIQRGQLGVSRAAQLAQETQFGQNLILQQQAQRAQESYQTGTLGVSRAGQRAQEAYQTGQLGISQQAQDLANRYQMGQLGVSQAAQQAQVSQAAQQYGLQGRAQALAEQQAASASDLGWSQYLSNLLTNPQYASNLQSMRANSPQLVSAIEGRGIDFQKLLESRILMPQAPGR